MNNGQLLKINELRMEKDEYTYKLSLINPAKIIAIRSGVLNRTGPRILGEEQEREVRMIVLEGNERIFVQETVDQLLEMIGCNS